MVKLRRHRFFILGMALLSLVVSGCVAQPARDAVPPDSVQSEASDTTAPQVAITMVPPETVTSDNVTLSWTGTDDRTPADRLTYSYFLEGYDNDYSSFTPDTSRTYTGLRDGVYTFFVKAHDQADNASIPVSTKFTVAIPKVQNKPAIEIPIINPIASTLLIVPNSDVSHIAVAFDNTVYAVDSPHARLYKSEHGGYGWSDISRGLGASGPWTDLAIAPDDPRTVVVVTNGGTEVYLSIDGGSSFGSTGLSARLGATERVECIAISPGYGGRDIAVGTSRGNGNGKIWVNTMEGFPSGWQDMSTNAPGWTDADIFAIAFSPAYDSDSTILALAATGPGTDNTYLYMGTRDLGSNTTVWNNSSGYPVQISQSGQDTPGTPLTYADIALPADYNAASPGNRHVYACWTDNPPGLSSAGNPNDDVYRIDDTVCYRLYVRNDVVCSLAHYGRFSHGKLLAGAVSASTVSLFRGPQVYYAADPNSQYPAWQSSQKPPTGPGQARVAWSADGRVAYCGTSAPGGGSNDQSAFSISTNNGFTWNQIGLIDL